MKNRFKYLILTGIFAVLPFFMGDACALRKVHLFKVAISYEIPKIKKVLEYYYSCMTRKDIDDVIDWLKYLESRPEILNGIFQEVLNFLSEAPTTPTPKIFCKCRSIKELSEL